MTILYLFVTKKNSVPIAWSSTWLKRVARPTLAGERLALTDAYDATLYISSVINDIFMNQKITIKAFTNNQSYDTIKTTKLPVDSE